jgi:hypothetical protein
MRALSRPAGNRPVEDDLCLDFQGGMNCRQTPNLLKENEYPEGMNLDMAGNVLLQVRPGVRINGTAIAAHPIRGLYFYDIAGTEQLFAACDNTINYWDGSAWAAPSGYTPSTASWVEMVQANDLLFLSDGTANVHSWNGSAFTDEANTNTDPPRCTIMEYIVGRLLCTGVATAPDTIYYSNALAPQTFARSTNNIRVGDGEGQAIVAMRKWDNFNLTVLKENSLWNVECNPPATPSSWTISPIHRGVGCVAPRTLCQVGDDMWFLSRHGVRSVRRLYQETQRQVSPPISEPIKPILDRINWSNVAKSTAIYWNNRYLLSVPLDSSSEPNYVLVFNTITESWTAYWTNLNVTAFAIQAFGGDARLVIGDTIGKVRKLMDRGSDSTWDDDGAAIPTKLVPRGLMFGDLQSEKTGKTVQVDFYKSQAQCTLTMLLDQSQQKVIDTGIETGSTDPILPVALDFILGFEGIKRIKRSLQTKGRFYMAQFAITTTSGYIAIRSIIASAFIETLKYRKN